MQNLYKDYYNSENLSDLDVVLRVRDQGGSGQKRKLTEPEVLHGHRIVLAANSSVLCSQIEWPFNNSSSNNSKNSSGNGSIPGRPSSRPSRASGGSEAAAGGPPLGRVTIEVARGDLEAARLLIACFYMGAADALSGDGINPEVLISVIRLADFYDAHQAFKGAAAALQARIESKASAHPAQGASRLAELVFALEPAQIRQHEAMQSVMSAAARILAEPFLGLEGVFRDGKRREAFLCLSLEVAAAVVADARFASRGSEATAFTAAAERLAREPDNGTPEQRALMLGGVRMPKLSDIHVKSTALLAACCSGHLPQLSPLLLSKTDDDNLDVDGAQEACWAAAFPEKWLMPRDDAEPVATPELELTWDFPIQSLRPAFEAFTAQRGEADTVICSLLGPVGFVGGFDVQLCLGVTRERNFAARFAAPCVGVRVLAPRLPVAGTPRLTRLDLSVTAITIDNVRDLPEGRGCSEERDQESPLLARAPLLPRKPAPRKLNPFAAIRSIGSFNLFQSDFVFKEFTPVMEVADRRRLLRPGETVRISAKVKLQA